MYEELLIGLRGHAKQRGCDDRCPCYDAESRGYATCSEELAEKAADAIEELLKAAKAMHTWIFLNTGDEQAVYDECGLTDEMNAMLGYGGQFVAELPKEET